MVKKSSHLARVSESQESEGTGCAEPISRCEGPLKTDFTSQRRERHGGNNDNDIHKSPTAACDDDGFQTPTENLRNGKILPSSNWSSNSGTTIIISTPFPHSMDEIVSLVFCDKQRMGLVGARRPLYTGALGDG